jgi:hypothetical protein
LNNLGRSDAVRSVGLVILNKNDAESLNIVLNEIDFGLFDFILGIDGNSSDHSLNIFKKHKIDCIKDIPGGRGGAIKYAISNLIIDYLIFLSSDGEEDPKDLVKIKEALLGGASLVIASRMKSNSGFKSDHNIFYIHRKFFLWFISYSIKLLFGGNIKDCWNGYRGVERCKALDMNLNAQNFLLEAQMTIKFLKKDLHIVEIPTKERARYHGHSQNPALISGWGHILLLVREFFEKE